MRLRVASGAFLCASSLRALEPVEREQPAGRELRPHLRHADRDRRRRASRDRARRASPRADSRAPRARARRSPWRSRVVSITGSMRRWIANSQSSCCRSASTADCMSGYCSLQASGLPSSERARCTWPSEAAAAGWCSNSANFSCQSAPSSAIMRRLTKAQPIGGASLCSFCSSLDVFGRQQLRDGRHQLGDLHDRALQPAERRGELERVARRGRASSPRQPAAPRTAPRRRRHSCRRGRSARRGRRSGFFRGRSLAIWQ